MEMPLTRFEECWPLLTESLPELTPLKRQHSNPNPNPLANQLRCIDFLTPPTPLIIPHRLPAFLESLMPLKKHSEAFHTFLWYFFPSLKQNCTAYLSSKVSSHPDCIFEIHQLWQSIFSRVYSNCCCSFSFAPEIININQSSHKMYSNNIVNFQESITILNVCTIKSGILLKAPCMSNERINKRMIRLSQINKSVSARKEIDKYIIYTVISHTKRKEMTNPKQRSCHPSKFNQDGLVKSRGRIFYK